MGMKTSTRRLLGCGVAGLTLAVAMPAYAADVPVDQGAIASADSVDGDIVVTARRRAESLQNTPVAISAFNSAQLESRQITTLGDVQRIAAGLTVSATSSGEGRPAYQIRGQRASATGIAFDPAVGVYFGEVVSARSAGTNQSVFDVSSIQVLKGPQGTLFGRNTTGGAILITPNAPTDRLEGYAKTSLGNYDLRELEGMVNLPLSDKIQVRAAGRVHRRDGYLYNFQTGGTAFDEAYESWRLSVRFMPSDNIKSDFVGTLYHSDASGSQARLFVVIPQVAPPATLAALQTALAANQALGFYGYRDPFDPHGFDLVKGAQNITEIELGDAGFLGESRIRNIFGYRDLKNRFSAFADGSQVGVLDTTGSYYGNQVSDELQLQGSKGPVNYVVGLYYFRESGTELLRLRNFSTLPISYNEYYGRNISKSAYAQFDVKLGGGISLTLGGRITQDKRYINGFYRQQVTLATSPTGFLCNQPGAAGALAITDLTQRGTCSQVSTATYTEPTWTAGLNWQVDPDHLLYVAHRHGYRAGAAQLLTAPNLEPETVNDIEVGSKNTFEIGGRRSRLNVAAYYGWYKNLQRTVAALLNGVGVAGTLNAAKARVYGLEADFSVQPVAGLELSASYALTIAKYDEFYNRVAGQQIDDRSAIFAFTPKHALNLSALITVPVPQSVGDVTFSANYSYMSSQAATDSNTLNPADPWFYNRQGDIPGYGLVNLRLDWRRFAGLGADVGVFVTNLADKRYYSATVPLANTRGIVSGLPGAPRMIGMDLKIPFQIGR